MKVLHRLVLIFILAAAPLGIAAAGDSRAAEVEVAQLDGRRVAALLKGDVKALEQIYADDFVYVHSTGRIDTKRGYLDVLASGNLVYLSQHYDPAPRVVMAGRDTAVVTGTVTIEIKNKTGKVTKRVLATSTVYVRAAAGWRAVLYQSTPVQS